MKKAIFTLLLLSITCFAFSQWNWVNPKPIGYTLNDVHFATEDIGYIAGNKGTLLKTLDGGETWEAIPQTIYNDFLKCWFNSVDTGYVSDGDSMYKTTNGGMSWSSLETGNTSWIRDICFTDTQTGFFVTEDGSIYKTSDGGNTWEVKISQWWSLTSVTFANDTRGIVTGNGGMYYLTDDGGETWIENQESNWTDLHDASYSDENHCYVSGQDNFLMKTTDGGITWVRVANPVAVGKLYFLTEQTGYAFASSDVVFPGGSDLLKTTDGGLSWTILARDYFRSLYVISEQNLIITGRAGRLLTTDNDCLTLTDHNPSITYDELLKVHFPSTDTGYAITNVYSIIKTIDGGENWVTLPVYDSSFRYKGLWFTDNTTGYVTEDSSLYKTTDGGITWNKFFTAPEDLKDVFFVDSDRGYITGDDYRSIYRTDDAGLTWNIIYQYPNYLRAIQFINRDTGFVALDRSLLKTTDGGLNWTQIQVDNSAFLLNMHFVNSQIGYMCGTNYSANRPAVYKTTDGGLTWACQIIYNSYDFGISIWFTDENKGFLGCTGDFFQTHNGGESWNKIEYMDGNFNCFWFTDQNKGFVVGSSGSILKTTNAGAVPVISPKKPASHFSLYPNPALNEITLSTNSHAGSFNVKIYNSKGLCSFDRDLTDRTSQINISALAPGLYILRISSAKCIEIKKLLVM